MSYYTDAIVTKEVQAYTNSTNFRTEFRLEPNKLYMSNMRLLNIGFVEKILIYGQLLLATIKKMMIIFQLITF